ncbi:MAG: c-type cytochrome [Candidatus Methylomirabilis sp.]
MSSRLFRSVAVMGAAVLALSLGGFLVRDGWSAEPPTGGGHHSHQSMKHDGGAMTDKRALATPKGWRFALPPGSPQAGRKVFADFECFKCHAVQGEEFPAPKADQGGVGPALAGMGAMHPAEYFAEAIINPNASVAWRIKHHKAEKQGFLGADGTSKMPSYNGAMTVQQLIDVVAYLKSLNSPTKHQH